MKRLEQLGQNPSVLPSTPASGIVWGRSKTIALWGTWGDRLGQAGPESQPKIKLNSLQQQKGF